MDYAAVTLAKNNYTSMGCFQHDRVETEKGAKLP